MSRQSIRNVLRASGNALHGDVATSMVKGQQRASLSSRSPLCRSLSSTSSSTISLTSSASATARRRSTARASTLSPAPAWRAMPSLCQGHVRLLSSTVPRSAELIRFKLPTSSIELDDNLQDIHNQIILPTYLDRQQHQLVYRNKFERRVTIDPITIELDGDLFRFGHMDANADIPTARAQAREAIGRMNTPADFQNLLPLLEGLNRAKRSLRPDDYARIARRAGERNCIFTVIECARQVQRTGFRLQTSETVAEILQHVQMKAVGSNWNEAETRQALTWAEMVVEMLEHPSHGRAPPRIPVPGEGGSRMITPAPPAPAYPLDRDPQVLAARLHLAAVVADKFGGADTDGKVSRYATEMVQLWPAGGKGLRALHPEELYTDRRGEMYYLKDHNKFLGVAAPLLHGLDTAIRVLGGSQGDSAALVGELQSRRDALGVEVSAALEAAPNRRGAAVYKKLFGEGTA